MKRFQFRFLSKSNGMKAKLADLEMVAWRIWCVWWYQHFPLEIWSGLCMIIINSSERNSGDVQSNRTSFLLSYPTLHPWSYCDLVRPFPCKLYRLSDPPAPTTKIRTDRPAHQNQRMRARSTTNSHIKPPTEGNGGQQGRKAQATISNTQVLALKKI